MAIERIDNGDGTTTFKGVDVVIPTRVAEMYDVEAVRSASQGEKVVSGYLATTVDVGKTVTPFVILTPRPTWKPPSNLPAGEYSWRSWGLSYVLEKCESWMFPQETASQFYRDWTNPSKHGMWQVHEDGTATYLGE